MQVRLTILASLSSFLSLYLGSLRAHAQGETTSMSEDESQNISKNIVRANDDLLLYLFEAQLPLQYNPRGVAQLQNFINYVSTVSPDKVATGFRNYQEYDSKRQRLENVPALPWFIEPLNKSRSCVTQSHAVQWGTPLEISSVSVLKSLYDITNDNRLEFLGKGYTGMAYTGKTRFNRELETGCYANTNNCMPALAEQLIVRDRQIILPSKGLPLREPIMPMTLLYTVKRTVESPKRVALKIQRLPLPSNGRSPALQELMMLAKIRYLHAQNLSTFHAYPQLFFLYTLSTKHNRTRALPGDLGQRRSEQCNVAEGKTPASYFFTEMEYLDGVKLHNPLRLPWKKLSESDYMQLRHFGFWYCSEFAFLENRLVRLPTFLNHRAVRLRSLSRMHNASDFEFLPQSYLRDDTFLELLYNEWATVNLAGFQIGDRNYENYVLTRVNETRVYKLGKALYLIPHHAPQLRRIDYGLGNDCVGDSVTGKPKYSFMTTAQLAESAYELDSYDFLLLSKIEKMTFYAINEDLTNMVGATVSATSWPLATLRVVKKFSEALNLDSTKIGKFYEKYYSGKHDPRELQEIKDHVTQTLMTAQVSPFLLMRIWLTFTLSTVRHIWLDLLVRYRFEWSLKHVKALFALAKGAGIASVLAYYFSGFKQDFTGRESFNGTTKLYNFVVKQISSTLQIPERFA